MKNPENCLVPHPGRVLARMLASHGISGSAMALKLQIHPNRVCAILRGERPITVNTALKFERFFGDPAEDWLAIQTRYDAELVRYLTWDEIVQDIHPHRRPADRPTLTVRQALQEVEAWKGAEGAAS